MENALQMPSLGRPFDLGMLYDCRNDRLLPGVTLWNHNTLKSSLDCRPQESSQFSVIAEDSLESKTSSLGVEAGLKLSLLGNLVDVSGSAKFLDDQRQSNKQARVSLQYSMTSRFEQLTMQHLAVDKFEHPDVFEKKDATHVVTAVMYGAEAFFVFDRKVEGKENFRDIHGQMESMIKKIPSVTISGDGKLDMKDKEINEVDRFQCQYHGDVLLPENPTTFQEAVKIYKQLPQIMQHEGKKSIKVVPKKVWLYPLCKLDSRAAQLVREISISLVTQAQKLIEDLRQYKIRALDLIKSEASNSFHSVHEHLARFMEMMTEYEMEIAKKLSVTLPQVRGGGAEETKLANIFLENSASPFSQHGLSTWLQGKEQENKMLQSYLTGMQSSSIQFAFDPGELNAIVADINVDNVLCFEFQIAGDHDYLLDSMFNYLRTNEASKDHKGVPPKMWFHNRAITGDIKTKMRAFVSFATTNGCTESTKFVVTSCYDEDAVTGKGADIVLYSDGLQESYEPPGKPGKPSNSNTTHNSITLSWPKPHYGAENVRSYIIMYQEVGIHDWERYVTNESSTSAILIDLKPETTYQVKVCGQCDIGYTQESDTSDHIKTEKSPDPRLAIMFKEISTCMGSKKGDHEIYKIRLTVCEMPSKIKGIAKCIIGNPRDLTLEFPEKVLMLVGATGSGKSTLINGIANYVLGVRWEDDFRFKLITEEASADQTKSVTQTITSYSFPRLDGSPLECRLTVVDMPGFGDIMGIERDEEITALIKDFFLTRGPEGIDHIDGIGFVAQSFLARLTHTQKYIIDSILSIFGKDIAGNIILMTTFADGAYPPVVDAIKTHITESDPPVPIDTEHLLYFKFNSSALFTKPKDAGKTTFDEMYWNVGCASLDDFFTHLLNTKQQTLKLTRAVFDERQKLQALIQGIQQDVCKGMNAIDEMRQEKQVLEENEAIIQANKDFTYQYHWKKVTLQSGLYATNCLHCNHTCHFPCVDTRNCDAMDSNGYCQVCPNHCLWNPHHVNNDFRYEEIPVTKHYADLEKKI